jgi:Xaa-Pro aminopeptidase
VNATDRFAPLHTATRLDRLRDAMASAEIPALMVSGRSNVRYLTGFTGSAGLLLVLEDTTVLVTDGRYATQAEEQLAASGAPARTHIVPAAGQGKAVGEVVTAARTTRLGLEAAQVSWALQRQVAGEWVPEVEVVPTVGLVESLRQVKEPGEINRIAAAAVIADDALATVRPMLAEGCTEQAFAHALDAEMRRRGAGGPSFPTICASGPNAAKPHHRPSERTVRPGEPVVIDFGAIVDGYCSDMTRTVWVGELSDPDLRRAVHVVAASQAAGVAAAAAGVACQAVDRACRQVIEEAGWGPQFVHGTGHGVGLDIHEAPAVSATSADTLAAGHVVTVEPGVYLPGLGGVRIEDTLVVTERGSRTLTSTPKEL